MPQRRRLNVHEAGRAIGMLQSGMSQDAVGRLMNRSQSVIGRMWQGFQETGSVQERPRSGRPRCTTARQDRQLVLQAKRNRFNSAVALNRDFHNTHGINMSNQTCRNRLHEANLRARRPATRPILTADHRVRRLDFASEHANWQIRHLRSVLFTDESKFCVDFNDGRRRVWRQKNERFSDCCVAEHDRFGGGSVMVWGGISIEGSTELWIIRNGALTGIRYRDEILHPIVRPFAGAMGAEFLLMDDNARPHRANIVNQYLEAETIERMDWPSKSPDLNPIEHVWDVLQRQIQQRNPAPSNVNDLEFALLEEWDCIPLRTIRSLIRSFPKRCRAVIQARGGHTKY